MKSRLVCNARALVVCFYPDREMLLNLVKSLSRQVSEVWILNNGGIEAGLERELGACPNLCIHTFESNVGIAAALNYGFSLAAQNQVEFVVTFDQDSQPTEDHVSALLEIWKKLVQQGLHKVGAIGPSFFDDRGDVVQFPFFRTHGLKVKKIHHQAGCNETPVDVLITSGMLVPVSMWREGLKFRDELFIDFVDTEWCFRANASGFTNFGCFSVSMRHQFSDAETTQFLGLHLLKYSPTRRYYYFRNSLYVSARLYVPLAHKFRVMMGLVVRLLTIPFIDEKPIMSLVYAMRGLRDGVLGISGKLNVGDGDQRIKTLAG